MNIYDTREEMIVATVPKGGIGCEVGVFAGEFSQYLLKFTEPKKLILIDAWELVAPNLFCADQHGNNGVSLPAQALFNTVKSRFASNPKVEIIKNWSHIAIPTITDKLDWVYIDADHSYEGCLRDLILIQDKMNDNCLIMGHDYLINKEKCKHDWQFGVGRAVDEFCAMKGWSIVAKGMDGCVSFCLKKC